MFKETLCEEMRKNVMFANFVSLGPNCNTAASMAKYGLRSWGGVFDWLVTPSLESVLRCIENDFDDFLKKENLKRHQKSLRMFKDTYWGFTFIHDKECPFEEKYGELKEKYQRRIDRFLEETTKATCFLRMVIRADEISYIMKNEGYINRVVKKRNVRNEIVFLVTKDIEVPKNFLFRYYIVEPGYEQPPELKLRSWFDQNTEFLEYCAMNFSSISIMKNVALDRRQKEAMYIMRCRTLASLLDYDFTNFSMQGNVVIYGAGNIGQLLYNRIKENCNVKCFVDRKKAGEKIEEIPIVDIENVDYYENTIFLVTVEYDYQNISREIAMHYNQAKIISIDDILNK